MFDGVTLEITGGERFMVRYVTAQERELTV